MSANSNSLQCTSFSSFFILVSFTSLSRITTSWFLRTTNLQFQWDSSNPFTATYGQPSELNIWCIWERPCEIPVGKAIWWVIIHSMNRLFMKNWSHIIENIETILLIITLMVLSFLRVQLTKNRLVTHHLFKRTVKLKVLPFHSIEHRSNYYYSGWSW